MKGKCTYVLSKHCHDPNGGKTKYEIRLVNKNRIECSSPGSKCEREIEIFIFGQSVAVLKQDPLFTTQYAGSTLQDVQIYYLGLTNVVVKSRKAGVEILWTGNNLYVKVASSMLGQTCGLCGTFDNEMNNDFHTHDDDNEISEQSFAQQWAVQEPGTTKCVDDKWDDTKPCDFYYDKKAHAVENCKILKDTTVQSLFLPCHKFVSPDEYYDHCLSDACASEKDFVHVVDTYIKMCADRGILIGWQQQDSGMYVYVFNHSRLDNYLHVTLSFMCLTTAGIEHTIFAML